MRESLLTDDEIAATHQRRLEGMKLQEIEGNPLTDDEVAMFEMFEHEGWSPEKCRAHIMAQLQPGQRSNFHEVTASKPVAVGRSAHTGEFVVKKEQPARFKRPNERA